MLIVDTNPILIAFIFISPFFMIVFITLNLHLPTFIILTFLDGITDCSSVSPSFALIDKLNQIRSEAYG